MPVIITRTVAMAVMEVMAVMVATEVTAAMVVMAAMDMVMVRFYNFLPDPGDLHFRRDVLPGKNAGLTSIC